MANQNIWSGLARARPDGTPPSLCQLHKDFHLDIGMCCHTWLYSCRRMIHLRLAGRHRAKQKWRLYLWSWFDTMAESDPSVYPFLFLPNLPTSVSFLLSRIFLLFPSSCLSSLLLLLSCFFVFLSSCCSSLVPLVLLLFVLLSPPPCTSSSCALPQSHLPLSCCHSY